MLIDGNSLINRAFYAMPVLTTKDGVFTNAVYGFMNMFFKMLSDEKPTFVAVAFDLKAPTFRHKMYSEYKAARKPMPLELRPQIPLLKDLLRLMGVTVIEKEGSEADDIIGTIAKHTSIQTVIITGDKDSFQLVDDQTEVHFTKRGITDVEIYTAKNFTEKTGIAPIQIIDLKALMGDSSDNIPGIAGVGEKTALTLIQTYGSVDALYNNVNDLKGKLLEKVVSGKESAYLSRTLATIDVDCGVDTDVEKMRFPFPFPHSVKRRFVELEFKSLYKKDELFEPQTEEQPSSQENDQPYTDSAKLIVEDLSFLSAITLSKGAVLYACDKSFNLFNDNTEYVFPIRQTLLDDGFAFSDVIHALFPVVNNCPRLVVFCKKAMRHFFDKVGKTLTAPCDDISIMKYLVDFSGRDESAMDVIESYNLSTDNPATSLKILFEKFNKKLDEEKVRALYEDVELPLSDILFDMEKSGFKVDSDALCELGNTYADLLKNLESQIRELAEQPQLNVNSPKQLGDVLFNKLQLGKGKKTKHGYSTSADVLESLEDAHPIVPLILKHRQAQKLYSTYIEGFKPLIEKDTGLIHTSFNQTVTATGRLSSKEPNLQNIPVREEQGRELRKFFIPRDNEHILVGADYSQIELRLLAAFSQCPALVKAFNSGIDVHATTASKVFGVELDKVTSQMRTSAKAVNFGVIYGISEYGLAKNLKISASEAKRYITSYFNEYPEVKNYMDKNVDFAKENGYAVTLLGRKRQIRELSSSNYNLRQFGERVAMNMPLQGSSADIIKLAMIGVSKRLKKENLQSKLILQVHDELIIDTYKPEKEKVEKILVEEMEGAVKLSVPLTVSLGSGERWFDAK